MTDQTATTTTVAQAISFAIDEFQEFGGHNDDRLGLYLGHVDDDSDLRVTEVSAELENAPNGLMSQFTIKTSDGQAWTVRVTPSPSTMPIKGTRFRVGDRVRSSAQGETFGWTGVIANPRNGLEGRIYVRWAGRVMACGYRMESAVADGLQRIED